MMVVFGQTIDEEINQTVHQFCACLQEAPIPGVREWVPCYSSVTLHYDPSVLFYEELSSLVCSYLSNLSSSAPLLPDEIEIPVCYGGEFGPDLGYVASYHQMSEEEVIRLHTAGTYRVYMLGFTPGFAYLGGLNPSLSTPRLSSPRTKIPAGSVGIAGNQTGVYPIASPGGWQLIGQTPYTLFEPLAETPFLLHAGQIVRFTAVCPTEFWRLKEATLHD